MTATTDSRSAAAPRSERRKARTRRALVDAAIQLMADGRGEQASIQEITATADVGFGSFYNHFDSKEQLFQTASEEMLEQWGQVTDAACAGIEDPAAVFATSLRIAGRLAWTDPAIAGFLTGRGLALLDSPVGLAPRALRDIRAAANTGRFSGPDPEVALCAVAGALLGLLCLHQRAPEHVDAASVDALTEACLRLLGMAPEEARRLVQLPMPPAPR